MNTHADELRALADRADEAGAYEVMETGIVDELASALRNTADELEAVYEQAAQIADRDAIGVTLAELSQFPVVQATGARIAFNIRAAAQKNGPAIAGALRSRGPHPKVTVLGLNDASLGDAEPPRIEDMAPGTLFHGHLNSFFTRTPLLLVVVGHMTVCKVRSGEMYSALDVDRSTIRDVTPPKEDDRG